MPKRRDKAPKKPARSTGWKQEPITRPKRRQSAGVLPHEFTEAARGPRLQKVMAEAGVGSRRHCEELIEAGAVRINGHLVQSLPAWVDPARDHIKVNGRLINPHQPMVYVMLFKPRGVVTTNSDPEGRPLAIELVKHPSQARLYPVGRLDMETSGLLLLTNDGELANRLTHPRHEVHKLYEITLSGALNEDDIGKLERGLFPSNREPKTVAKSATRPAQSKLTLMKRDRDRTKLMMEMGEGRIRHIRQLMAALGHKVRKLRRVGVGPLKLKGLQPGQWRDLTERELKELRQAAGLGGAASALRRRDAAR